MKKAESPLTEIFREREKFFRDLTYSLITCRWFIFTRNFNFPPNKEECEDFITSLREMASSQGGVFELDKPVNKKRYKDLVEELEKNIEDLQEWKDLKEKKKGEYKLYFAELFPCSLLMSNLYYLLARGDVLADIQFLRKLGELGNFITSQAYELIGYSIAKREESIIHRGITLTKTENKEINKTKLINLRDEYLKLIEEDVKKNKGLDAKKIKEYYNKFIRDAMAEIDMTERTVKNLLKEIAKDPA